MSSSFRTNALRLIGAFGAGIAFTGVTVASWSAWTALQSTEPPPAKVSQSKPEAASKANGPHADARTPQHTAASSQPKEKPAAQQATQHRPCEQQTWPYLDQHCLQADGAAATKAGRRIRVVSTDKRGPVSVMGSTTIGTSHTGNAAASTPQAPASTDAAATEAPPQPSAAQPMNEVATSSVPLPPQRPRWADKAASPTRTADAQHVPEQKKAPKRAPARNAIASDTTGGNTTASDDEARNKEARDNETEHGESRASRRQADARDAQDRDARPWPARTTWRGRQQDESEDEAATGPAPRGNVTVVQTYVMPNGRRIIVRKVYRDARRGDVEEAQDGDDVQAGRTGNDQVSRADDDDDDGEVSPYRYQRPFRGYIVRPRGFVFGD
jgi:hypothetical protein